MTHICVGKQTIIGSDHGLSPGRRQAIIYTNAGILLIGSLGTNFSEISIKSLTFSFTKIRLKVSSAKWRPFCPGLNGLRPYIKAMVHSRAILATSTHSLVTKHHHINQGIDLTMSELICLFNEYQWMIYASGSLYSTYFLFTWRNIFHLSSVKFSNMHIRVIVLRAHNGKSIKRWHVQAIKLSM